MIVIKELVNEIFQGNQRFRNPTTVLAPHQRGQGIEWEGIYIQIWETYKNVLVLVKFFDPRVSSNQIKGMLNYLSSKGYRLVSVIVTPVDTHRGREFWWSNAKD